MTVRWKGPHAVAPRGQRRAVAMRVNLTPAIDVTFLLLIFFVVATRFAPDEGLLSSRLPKERGVLESTPLPVSPIRVRVSHAPDGYRLTIDNWRSQPASFAELTALLEDIQSRPGFDAATPVVIVPDDAVAWDHVTNCFNAVRRVNFDPGAGGAPFENITFAFGPSS